MKSMLCAGSASRTPRISSPTRATASSSPPSLVRRLARVDEVDELTEARESTSVEGEHETREVGKLSALGGKRAGNLLGRTLQDVGEAERDLVDDGGREGSTEAYGEAVAHVAVRVKDPVEALDLPRRLLHAVRDAEERQILRRDHPLV